MNRLQKIAKIKEVLLRRRWWIVFSIIFFVAEVYLFSGPLCWIKEDKSFWLTGEGSLELEESEGIYIQQIVPQYDYIKSISLLFQDKGFSLQSGSVSVMITDSEDQILFDRDIPYTQLAYGSYSDIETDIHLKAGREYWLIVECGEDSAGQKAALSMCSSNYYMAENRRLICQEEIPDMQLVTRYVYGETVAVSKLLILLLLSLVTALGIALGLPSNNICRSAAGIILLLAAPMILGKRLELIALNQDTGALLPMAIQWNIALMYLLELLVLLCTQSARCGIVVTNSFLMVIYTVNYYVWIYRAAPFKFSDLTAFSTVVRVMDGYDLQPDIYLSTVWCIFLIFLVYGLQAGRPLREIRLTKKYIALRLGIMTVGICAAIGSGYLLLYTDFLKEKGFLEFHGFDEYMTYRFDGYLVSTCLNIQGARIRQPEEYSRANAESILQEALASRENLQDLLDEEELPHIILIMNESFSDLQTLGNLEVSEDYLPFFDGLKENTVRGYVNASVLGGGTANSEFEVFTGCSMGLLPQAYYPYQQVMSREVPSLVSNVETFGYTTYSIHPEIKTNWNRDRVYQYLGFDHSLWLEDFEGAETINRFISDGATYDKIISLYENRTEGEKLFIFDLTMQNHGGYVGANIENPIILNAPSDEAEFYLTLIRLSDKSFEQLVTYFADQDEKVLICMFGDHQPKFANEEFYDTLYATMEGQSETDRILSQYKVPFVIWANYEIEEQEGLDISMNYLGGLLLETAGIPRSAYFQFLCGLRQEYPIITANGYADAEGNFSTWSGEDTEFLEYRILQYNYLFDKLAEGF